MNSNTYCVIMAGGIGSRFWPLSQTSSPKQFLDILGTGQTLIQQTFNRFRPICPTQNFYIVTNEQYKEIVLEQLPELTPEQVLTEPLRRNTAPCIAYANAKIKKVNPRANIIVSPADHLILKEEDFKKVITEGLEFVDKNQTLLTLGIKPNRPETGYGYIQISSKDKNTESPLKQVKTFTEKPNKELAKVFFESGEFFWNSGIFLWSLHAIEKAFDELLPEVYSLFNQKADLLYPGTEEKAIREIYMECKNISIDYGIMEKASNVYVYVADFGWSDLGTWSSLYDHSIKDDSGNAKINGRTLLYDTEDSIINVPKGKTVVIQGLSNYIVVDSGKELLICPKENEQQIRQFSNDVNTELN